MFPFFLPLSLSLSLSLSVDDNNHHGDETLLYPAASHCSFLWIFGLLIFLIFSIVFTTFHLLGTKENLLITLFEGKIQKDNEKDGEKDNGTQKSKNVILLFWGFGGAHRRQFSKYLQSYQNILSRDHHHHHLSCHLYIGPMAQFLSLEYNDQICQQIFDKIHSHFTPLEYPKNRPHLIVINHMWSNTGCYAYCSFIQWIQREIEKHERDTKHMGNMELTTKKNILSHFILLGNDEMPPSESDSDCPLVSSSHVFDSTPDTFNELLSRLHRHKTYGKLFTLPIVSLLAKHFFFSMFLSTTWFAPNALHILCSVPFIFTTIFLYDLFYVKLYGNFLFPKAFSPQHKLLKEMKFQFVIKKTLTETWEKCITKYQNQNQNSLSLSLSLSPFCFLYSTKDSLVPFESIERTIDMLRETFSPSNFLFPLQWKITQNNFVTSGHVAHMKSFPILYQQIVERNMRNGKEKGMGTAEGKRKVEEN